jgi:aromatic-L-amino-acid/L-tryptophan decarboxylase
MQELSITTFRYVPRDLRAHVGEQSVERHLDALNRELVDRLQRGGEAFVSNAIVGGRYVLRARVVNFHTNRGDVEAVPEIAARIAEPWTLSYARTLRTPIRREDGGQVQSARCRSPRTSLYRLQNMTPASAR